MKRVTYDSVTYKLRHVSSEDLYSGEPCTLVVVHESRGPVEYEDLTADIWQETEPCDDC